MSKWWHEAIFDTCSLITLDKMFQDDPELEVFFPRLRSIVEVFSSDNLKAEIRDRMRPRCEIVEGPGVERFLEILTGANAPLGMSDVDRLVYAASIHLKTGIVTGEKPMAKLCIREKVEVGNIATILQDLVTGGEITQSRCSQILLNLTRRGDYFLPSQDTQNWQSLKDYRFP